MLKEQPVVACYTSVKWAKQLNGTDLDKFAFRQARRGSQSVDVKQCRASSDLAFELVIPHCVSFCRTERVRQIASSLKGELVGDIDRAGASAISVVTTNVADTTAESPWAGFDEFFPDGQVCT